MTAAVLSIGTELTRGELVNTNAAWLSASLTELGFEVIEHVVVDDDRKRIVEALERLGRTARVIVSTGGLGPTTDDLTTDAVAKAMGKPLVRDEPSLLEIKRRFEKFQRVMSESNAKQADFPEGADILANPNGTAPGFSVSIGSALAFFMPGVPREMKPMFETHVVQRIRSLAPSDRAQIRLSTFGLPESVVGERLKGVEEAFPGVIIGYRAHFPEIEVKVLAKSSSIAAARELCDRATAEVRSRLNDVIFGEGGDSLPTVVARMLRAKGVTLSLAESCTGGLLSSLLTKDAGASDFFLAGAVTYSNSAKTRLLGVGDEVIRGHGAVSSEVAAAMAEGARHVIGSDYALSITGIAGPGGGSPEKPVGTVFLAIASASGTVVKERKFHGERAQIQTLAAYAALHLIRETVSAR